jgi:tetratricopeptide (TPR) repeat protein
LPVATTWSLSFAQVEQNNPAAADLLRLCAFLAPDAIPEEIVTQGAEHLGPQLAPMGADSYLLNQSIEALRTYSLLRREASSKIAPTLSIHRLVQAVLKDQMNEQDRKLWAERAVRAVNTAFPYVEHQTWPQCDRLLPHALLCAELIAQEQMTLPEATRLLNQAGRYLNERARYTEAEPLYQRALAIREQQLGAQHPDTAQSLNNLAMLYQDQGKDEQAEPLYQHALSIREQQLEPRHPDTAQNLNNLALLFKDQGKYEQAKPLLKRALSIDEHALGLQHPTTQAIRASYAHLLRTMGRDAEAAALDQP